jgi:hypothetical protein
MLGIRDEQPLKICRVGDDYETFELPPAIAEGFYNLKGPMPRCYENRRTFHRFYFRQKAVVIHREMKLGVYTTDVSRHGIGFLCARQLMPRERVQLVLPNAVTYQLDISRCRRSPDGIFECGGRFAISETPDIRSISEVTR